MFLVFKSNQIEGDEYTIKKMKRINWVDFFMYLTLIITAFIGLSLNLLVEKLNQEMITMLFIVIMVVNCVYILFWTWKLVSYIIQRIKLIGEDDKMREDQRKVQEEINLKKQMGIDKIDQMIEQLNMLQRDIADKS